MPLSNLKYQIFTLSSFWSLSSLKTTTSFILLSTLNVRLIYYLTSTISYHKLAATHLAIFLLAFTWLPTTLSTLTDFIISSLFITTAIKFLARFIRRSTPRFWLEYLLVPVLVATLIHMSSEIFQSNKIPDQSSIVFYHIDNIAKGVRISKELAWNGTWTVFWGWVAMREVPEYCRPLVFVLMVRAVGAVQMKLEERRMRVQWFGNLWERAQNRWGNFGRERVREGE